VRGIQRAASVYFVLECGTCRWVVGQVRVSTVDPHFATAVLRPRTAKGAPLQGADLLLWHGTVRWAVISYGSDPGTGCGYVRSAVRKELFGTAACL